VHLIYIIPPIAGIALAAAIGWLIERENVPRKEVPRGSNEKSRHRPPDGIRDTSGGPAVHPAAVPEPDHALCGLSRTEGRVLANPGGAPMRTDGTGSL
jgi:hypothetical protein